MKKRRFPRQKRSVERSSRSSQHLSKPRRVAFEALENRWLLASVGLSAISNVTLPAGTSIFVPLNADDPGKTVSFAATVSDYSKVTPVVMPQTNKSLQLNVSINSVDQPMTFQLFDNLAPTTTAHIEGLVQSGYYNGLSIYRNGKDAEGNDFVIQGGNNPPTGSIKANQASIAEEFHPDLRYTTAGILAMARSTAPSTSSTEFFIMEEPYRSLDFNYTAFGFQTTGTGVVDTIAAMPNQSSTQDPNHLGYLQTPLTISSASIFTDTQNGVLELRAPSGVAGTVTVTVTASDGTNAPTTQTFTVTIQADSTSSPANPFASVIPAAPSSVAYVPPTGASSQVTNRDNSTSDKTLQFQVSGVTSGNVVQILADGNVIGQATASGTTVTVTTDGSTKLTEGAHKFTAIQVAKNKTVSVTESGSSTPLSKTSDAPSLNASPAALTLDLTGPTVTISRPTTQSDPTNTGPIHFTAVFSEAVTDFTSSDVIASGSATGTLAATVTPSGTDGKTYDIAISGMTGGGAVAASIGAGAAHDAAGNPNASSNVAQVVYDVTGPTVAINLASTQPDPTNTGPIHFTAVFNETVTDFTAADVTLGGTAAGTLTAVVTSSGTDGKTYDVAVSGMTGAGTVIASIGAGAAHDAAGNASAASSSSDNTVAYDPAAMTVTVNKASTQADPTNTGPVHFTVVFSRPVSDFVADDVFLGGTAPGNLMPTVTAVGSDGTTYDVSVSGMTGSGTITAKLTAGMAHDSNNNPNLASTSTDNEISYDLIGPTVTISKGDTQPDPTNTGPIHFIADFSEAVTDFTASDVTLGGTATGTLTATVTPIGTDGKSYDIVVSGMTGAGTVTASIAAGVAHDAAGNASTASTSSDNTVDYDPAALGVTINQASTQADLTNTGPIHFTVVFDRAVSDFTSADVTMGGTAPGTRTATVTAIGTDGKSYDVAVSGMTGDGTVTASLTAGVAHDASNKPNLASTSTDNQVTYDVTVPTVTVNQASDQDDPVSTGSIHFTVVFSEAVSDFVGGDVALGGTAAGTLSATVTPVGTDGKTYDVAVSGMTGSGTVTASLLGGAAHDAAGNLTTASTTTDNQVTYQSSSPGTPTKLFDFGTSSSPVKMGYTRVTDKTDYTSARGYGWSSGTIYSVDRGSGTDGDRDLNFTADGTFQVDLEDGTYQVVVRIGDLGHYVHDQMAISLQGDQVDTLSTKAGQILEKTYTLNVSGGQLELKLEDMGDVDPFATIESLTIAPVDDDLTAPTVAVSLAPGQQATAVVQPIYFAVDFSEPVTGFTADGLTVGGTATQGTLTKTVTGSGASYVVAVSGFTASGTVTLSADAEAASDLSGNASEASPDPATDNTVTYNKPTTVLQYQFGTATSPLVSGYVRATESTTYTAGRGFGWKSGTIRKWDRGTGSAMGQSFNFTTDGTFQVDLANGTYQVDVTLGDVGNYVHDQMGVFLQGKQVDNVSTSAGEMVTRSYTVKITDGKLLLQLKDFGDLDPNAVIHSLVVSSAAGDTAAPTVAVSPAPWQQSTAVAQPIYFAVDFSEPVTGFTADGVTVAGTATQGALAKTVTGTGASYVVGVSGFTATGTVTLNVAAGKATDLSGNQNQAAPSAATVTYSKPTSALLYDFGTADSPLADGHTRVTGQTTYNGTTQHFGWQSGTVVSWDRKGTGAALTRDFNFTNDGTFVADVPNGTYRVDLIMGDLGRFAHDQVGIFLQGETAARDTVSTSAGQVLSKRYDSVTVSDGHLKIRLKDQGGTDPNAVLQAIDIALM